MRGWVAAGAVVLGLGAWGSGALDEPLSAVGLHRGACAEILLTGNRLCGEQLVSYCLRFYDPEINAGVCDDPLYDAGYDPAQVARDIREEEDRAFDREYDRLTREER